MLKKLLGLLAVIGTIFGAIAGSKKSKELKELENKIDESKKEEISPFFDNLPKESIWNQMDEWGNGVVDEVQEHESLSKPEDDEEKKQATDINDDIDC